MPFDQQLQSVQSDEFEQLPGTWTTFPRPRVLPQELFDLIVDFCGLFPEQPERPIDGWGGVYAGPRWKILHALSLTCRAFHYKARSILYPSIYIYRDTQTTPLLHSLQSSPELGSSTRFLAICNDIDQNDNWNVPSSHYADKMGINSILRQLTSRLLPNLETLELDDFYPIFHPSFPIMGYSFKSVKNLSLSACIFHTFQDLRRFVSCFPSLESLDLEEVEWLSEGITGLSQDSFARFPRSRALSFKRLILILRQKYLQNVTTWLSSTRTVHSLEKVELLAESDFKNSIRAEAVEASAVCNFMRNAKRLSFVEIEFDYFIYLVNEQGRFSWAHLKDLSILRIPISSCETITSLLGTVQDLGDLVHLSLNFEATGFPEQYPSTSAADYAPWNDLDNLLSGDPFRKIRDIDINVVFYCADRFRKDPDGTVEQEGRRWFPKLYDRINRGDGGYGPLQFYSHIFTSPFFHHLKPVERY
ncbi:hypothetical protein C8Q75DRAFT_623442 [Abortiporus biennis]|nr:hypothetical protein C8Q75DRAFT_623442 [Abortiporus biennis]